MRRNVRAFVCVCSIVALFDDISLNITQHCARNFLSLHLDSSLHVLRRRCCCHFLLHSPPPTFSKRILYSQTQVACTMYVAFDATKDNTKRNFDDFSVPSAVRSIEDKWKNTRFIAVSVPLVRFSILRAGMRMFVPMCVCVCCVCCRTFVRQCV